MLVSLVEQYKVTNVFGSPALMNTLSRHLAAHSAKLPTIRRALSAGAPVSPDVVERMLGALGDEADLHTPYGATECLPVATIAGRELLAGPAEANRRGQGICVGRPLAVNRIRIIRISDQAIERLEDSRDVERGEIGEICVSGPTVTDAYWQRAPQTRLAKMRDEQGTVWHRMGDLGWLDDEGRLWYCGRKSERVRTTGGPLFTECVEGLVNAVPGVYRSALVGIGPDRSTPLVIVEPESGQRRAALMQRVRDRMSTHDLTRGIQHVAMQRSLPVDIRHNAKIRRGQLSERMHRKLRRAVG
jgi:acyl-CoA synthetase (AMP-forming)/AMP-acid ligase II